MTTTKLPIGTNTQRVTPMHKASRRALAGARVAGWLTIATLVVLVIWSSLNRESAEAAALGDKILPWMFSLAVITVAAIVFAVYWYINLSRRIKDDPAIWDAIHNMTKEEIDAAIYELFTERRRQREEERRYIPVITPVKKFGAKHIVAVSTATAAAMIAAIGTVVLFRRSR